MKEIFSLFISLFFLLCFLLVVIVYPVIFSCATLLDDISKPWGWQIKIFHAFFLLFLHSLFVIIFVVFNSLDDPETTRLEKKQ